MVRTNPIVIFRLPMIPTDHFHPNAGLFGILRKSVIWPLPSVNFVISSLIWTSWDTAEVSVSFFGAPKHLWFCILVGAIHRFHDGSVNHSNRNSARPRWNCIVGNHEKLYSLKRILVDCVGVSDIRQTFYNVYSMFDLFTNVEGDTILKFLKEINLYSKI